MAGPLLMAATLLLVTAGCGLYVAGAVGWAQMAWVLASGTAGAGVVLMMEKR